MYAIIETGGKQVKVEKGANISVEKLDFAAGEDVILDKVLFVGDGAKYLLGTPHIKGASVKAKVVAQKRAPKIVVFKKRSKKGYKKTIGHRQYMTELKIEEINSGN